jgi:uncharacterized membrane protein YedE/YeeE
MVHTDNLIYILGGVCIGIAASTLMATLGRICGISGISFGLISTSLKEVLWRMAFICGLIIGSLIIKLTSLAPNTISFPASYFWIVIGGIFVGVGAKIGNGCTSGHAICGIARLSQRSVIATLIFMLTAGIVVFIKRHLL